jgi:hypothetical protein
MAHFVDGNNALSVTGGLSIRLLRIEVGCIAVLMRFRGAEVSAHAPDDATRLTKRLKVPIIWLV